MKNNNFNEKTWMLATIFDLPIETAAILKPATILVDNIVPPVVGE